MVDSLVFHIGDHKTGTTSLQYTLAQKSWSCDSVPLCYPSSFNHNPLMGSLRQPAQYKSRPKRFSKLLKDMNQARGGVGVVSAEALENVPPAILRETLESHMPQYAATARVIAYVRPHAERIVSSWAEQVKLGLFTDSLEDFHEHSRATGRFYYHQRFTAWRNIFGDRFTLRPMIRDQLYKDSVVQDFLRYALQTDDFTVNEIQSNESMSLQDMALMKMLSAVFQDTQGHAKIQANIGRIMDRILSSLPPRARNTKPKMTKSLIPEVIATYQQDAQKLDADFFEGAPMWTALQNAPQKAVERSASIDPNAHFSPDEQRTIRALAQLITELSASDKAGLRQYLQEQVKDGFASAGPKKRRKKQGKRRKKPNRFNEDDLLDLI